MKKVITCYMRKEDIVKVDTYEILSTIPTISLLPDSLIAKEKCKRVKITIEVIEEDK